jgi:penicillin-binding protein 1C
LSQIFLPRPLFPDHYSKVIYSSKGDLLGAKIAPDYQWRFPSDDDSVPEKFKTALLEYEDSRFYYHPGIDPAAVLRALYLNITKKRIVSGASTLSMQVVRIALNNKERTFLQKLFESVLTLGLEFKFSKNEILKLYAAHAPFGGNVVGVKAASWRYFGRSVHDLTWAESAMLAVLPNSPSLIHPGKNRGALKKKRDLLLKRLYLKGTLTKIEYDLAVSEKLPEKPLPLPRFAPHLLETLANRRKDQSIFHTTLNTKIQSAAMLSAEKHYLKIRDRGIYNLCAIIIDNSSSDVVAYIGNSPGAFIDSEEKNSLFISRGYSVDIIRRPRSTGSILKPVLYAAMLQEGDINSETLIPDVPMHFGGYSPENFTRSFYGAVKARRALSESLNVPSVALIREYGYQRFYSLLKSLGITTLFRSADGYGLTLILGGAEGTLWDIASVYSNLARLAENETYQSLSVLKDEKKQSKKITAIGAGAAYLTFEALLDVERPGIESHWKSYSSSQQIAWKTGTSLGHRDAWAVGVTKKYTIGVWCGNSDGVGIQNMTGLSVAAPLMFDLFGTVDRSDWFTTPVFDLKRIEICAESGRLATENCPRTSVLVPLSANFNKSCSYHRIIHLNEDLTQRVHSGCYPVSKMQHQKWFLLPPVMEYYFIRNHSWYRKVPPFAEACDKGTEFETLTRMSLIYPPDRSKVYIPIDISGEKSEVVLRAAHISNSTVVHWHLNNIYLGNTERFHEMAIQPEPGKQTITLVDSEGYSISREFTVLNRD